MPTIDAPSATVRQVSGRAPDGRWILSVLVKQTCVVLADGRCVPAAEPVPLCEEPAADPDAPELLAHDYDLYAYKPATDVVLAGHAYGYGRPQFEAAVRVAGWEKRLLVVGDRTCELRAGGAVVFSPPAPVEAVPLRYTHAYGGRDTAAEAKYGNPLRLLGEALEPAEVAAASPFAYPRNPCGRGYVIEPTAEAVAALRLPNLEDPADPLTPARLFASSPAYWSAMPLPHATGWVNYGWFPRVGYFGVVPPHAATHPPTAEVARGLATPDVLTPHPPTAADAFRGTCGASLGMQYPHLRGGEVLAFDSLHPAHARFALRLPDQPPAIWTDGRQGRLNATQPALHTVTVDLDRGLLTLLWCGWAPALRPYGPDELAAMPLRVAA